jgi:hypothetical protein
MNKVTRNICVTVLICITAITAFGVFPVKCSGDSYTSMASSFIREALPIDVSKYNLTVTRNSVLQDAVDCTLKSENSVLIVNCYIQNNNLRGCNLYIKNGSIIYDKPYSNLADLAAGFLQKYQTLTGRDSTELISTLPSVDITGNSTAISGNTKLSVFTTENGNIIENETNKTQYTRLAWAWSIQGVNYPIMSISFKDGAFYGFTDTRGIYTIGDTTVNISEEQAIDAAMEYLKTYSYNAGGSPVSGFDVDENRTVAQLTCTTKNSTVWYPMWNVIVFLDHIYPGSVKAFSIAVWAKSGEVFHIGFHEELGQPPEYYSYPETNSLISPPNPDSQNPNPPLNTYLVIATVALTIAIIAIVAVIKKKTIVKKKRAK